MTRYTQRQLKNLVAMGAAIDVTYANDTKDIPESYIQIGYSAHQYDCGGKTATTITLDSPIAVLGLRKRKFSYNAPRRHLSEYFKIEQIGG